MAPGASDTPGDPVTSIPRLLLIADGFTQPDIASRVLSAVKAGVPWIQLRDHHADPAEFETAADTLMSALARLTHPPLVSVNSRLEVADTRRTAFHTGTHGPRLSEAAGRLAAGAIVGASVHSVEEALRARSEGARYVTFSPVYPTGSKPGHPGHGLAALGEIARRMAPIPVLALGGVTPGRVAECVAAGAHGIAVLGGILDADDIERAVRLYSDSISQGQGPDAWKVVE